MAYKVRLAEFDSILQAEKIDLSKLQELCFAGIPDDGGRRALCWRLLLHYLPLDRSCWLQYLADKRKQYHSFVDDIVVGGGMNSSTSSSSEALHNSRPSDIGELETSSGSISRHNNSFDTPSIGTDINTNKTPSSLPVHKRSFSNTSSITNSSSSSNSLCSDHPLNLSPDSQWVSFFKDNEVLGQIDKDVKRLCPDMCFFQRVTPHPRADTPRLCTRVTHTPLHSAPLHDKLSSSYSRQRGSGTRKSPSPPPEPLPPGTEAHWEVLERLLFIYAKLNPGQGYVQGMNEIIGPLYYVLATAPSDAEHAEADTFWLFTSLMADVRDLFIRTLDESESGIGRLMTRLMSCLKDEDAATSSQLTCQGIKEQYFAFRWLSLLFSQEFPLPDVIRMWDSVLASPDRHRCLLLLATAMIVLQREKLLSGDFASNVKLLQNYPPCDVGAIISKAVELSDRLVT